MPPGLQTFLEGVSAWAGLLWVVFIVIALGVVGRFMVKAYPKAKLIFAMIDAVLALPAFMEKIRAQVENDHDSNLRDELTEALELANETAGKVAQVLDAITALTSWQQKHQEKSDAAFARIAALERKKES